MRLNTTALALMLSFTVVSIGCSSKDDPKVPASAGGGAGGTSGSGSDYQGTWTEKSGFDAWQSFTSGSKSKEEACKAFKYVDPSGHEVIAKGGVSWLDGDQAKTCEWGADWKSSCNIEGTFAGNVMTMTSEDGSQSAQFNFSIKEEVLELESITVDGQTKTKEELMASGDIENYTPMVRISEEQILKMDQFIHETCNMPRGEPVQ